MTTDDYPDVAPFSSWMGLTLLASGDGEVRLQLVQRDELNNRGGTVHGGVVATLLDSAMTRAARTIEEGIELAGTVDLHVQFMRPALGTLTATGSVTSASRNFAFCRGEVRDRQDVLVATALATVRLRRVAR
jgi:uncharacterized protein (TIGR00369 family)